MTKKPGHKKTKKEKEHSTTEGIKEIRKKEGGQKGEQNYSTVKWPKSTVLVKEKWKSTAKIKDRKGIKLKGWGQKKTNKIDA